MNALQNPHLRMSILSLSFIPYISRIYNVHLSFFPLSLLFLCPIIPYEINFLMVIRGHATSTSPFPTTPFVSPISWSLKFHSLVSALLCLLCNEWSKKTKPPPCSIPFIVGKIIIFLFFYVTFFLGGGEALFPSRLYTPFSLIFLQTSSVSSSLT